MPRTLRSTMYDVVEGGEAHGRAYTTVELLFLALIAVSVAATIFETLESLAALLRGLFATIEWTTATIMTVEYGLRLWMAPEREPTGAAEPWRARVRYVTSPSGVIDLLAIVPFYANFLWPIDPDWLRILRLLRLLKVGRYTPALALFAAVIRNESRPLLATLTLVVILLVLESGVMFVLERDAQPGVFASIPHTMWWGIVTLTTVGYGDAYPITAPGKMFAGVVLVLGIAIFAVPAGILATGFANEIRKRDFVVTWQTVARVPLFAGLDAGRIAEIARLLSRQVVPPKYAVVRHGEPADAMFFVMSGQVEVEVRPHPVRLGPGQFFGEIGLLHDTVRMATVTTVTECQLLSLAVADSRRLLEANPSLKAAITQVAEQRTAAAQASQDGPSAPGKSAGRS